MMNAVPSNRYQSQIDLYSHDSWPALLHSSPPDRSFPMSYVLKVLYAVFVVPVFALLVVCSAMSGRISRREMEAEAI